MGKTETTSKFDLLLADIYRAIGTYLGEDGVAPTAKDIAEVTETVKTTTKAMKGKAKAPAKKATDPRAEREAELQGKTVKALRKICLDLDFEDEDVADAEKADLIDAILQEEFPDDAEAEAEDDEDEVEDEDEEEDEEDEDSEEGEEAYTREELEGMNLRELKALAKEAGYAAADLKGLDQDAVVDLLLEESEEDEDEEEEEEDEEDESDEDEDAYTEEDLQGMSATELRALAKEWEIKIPRGTGKDGIIALLLEEE